MSCVKYCSQRYMEKNLIIISTIAYLATLVSGDAVRCTEGMANQNIRMNCRGNLALHINLIDVIEDECDRCVNRSIPRSEWEPDLLKCSGQSSCGYQLRPAFDCPSCVQSEKRTKICYSCEQSVKEPKQDKIYINCKQGTEIQIIATLSFNDPASESPNKVYFSGNRLFMLKNHCNGLSSCDIISSPGRRQIHVYEQIMFRCISPPSREPQISTPPKINIPHRTSTLAVPSAPSHVPDKGRSASSVLTKNQTELYHEPTVARGSSQVPDNSIDKVATSQESAAIWVVPLALGVFLLTACVVGALIYWWRGRKHMARNQQKNHDPEAVKMI